jgi:hypothetical protein
VQQQQQQQQQVDEEAVLEVVEVVPHKLRSELLRGCCPQRCTAHTLVEMRPRFLRNAEKFCQLKISLGTLRFQKTPKMYTSNQAIKNTRRQTGREGELIDH